MSKSHYLTKFTRKCLTAKNFFTIYSSNPKRNWVEYFFFYQLCPFQYETFRRLSWDYTINTNNEKERKKEMKKGRERATLKVLLASIWAFILIKMTCIETQQQKK